MPLTSGELDRVRAELNYHLLSIGAQPFIGVHQVFDQIVAPFLREGLETTCATSVTVAQVGTPVTLTLASAAGIAVHEHVALDVDSLFEKATVRSISGSTITVILGMAHPATFPVTFDGGLLLVREALAAIALVRSRLRPRGTGGIKKVDEVEFYEVKGKTEFQVLTNQLRFYQAELADRLGVPKFLGAGQSCGGSIGLF